MITRFDTVYFLTAFRAFRFQIGRAERKQLPKPERCYGDRRTGPARQEGTNTVDADDTLYFFDQFTTFAFCLYHQTNSAEMQLWCSVDPTNYFLSWHLVWIKFLLIIYGFHGNIEWINYSLIPI